MVAATETEIGKAQQSLATECGVVAEFTSAATIAALGQAAQDGALEGKVAVAVITGGRIDN
jgi:threonine synthase